MGPGFAEEIGRQLFRWIAVLAVVCLALGALLMWGIPKLWEILKPWIHSIAS